MRLGFRRLIRGSGFTGGLVFRVGGLGVEI